MAVPRPLNAALGAMNKLAAILLLLTVGCSTTRQPMEREISPGVWESTWKLPGNPILRQDLAGVWVTGDATSEIVFVVFEESGIHCAFGISSEADEFPLMYQRGSWRLSGSYIHYSVDESLGWGSRTSEGEELFEFVRSTGNDKILKGFECSHCTDGVLAVAYSRANSQLQGISCDEWRLTTH